VRQPNDPQALITSLHWGPHARMAFRPSKPSPATPSNASPTAQKNLATFDHLDFDSWNKKDYDLFAEIHAEDVRVVYPEGVETHGYAEHEKWAKDFFAAFDSTISEHPIRLADGDWTSVVGEISITFARPLKMPDGKTIPPTKKTWKGRMCTVARWKDGRIAEEFLFWDNAALQKGVGLA